MSGLCWVCAPGIEKPTLPDDYLCADHRAEFDKEYGPREQVAALEKEEPDERRDIHGSDSHQHVTLPD